MKNTIKLEYFAAEEAALKTKYLINELNRGHQLFVADCRWLQDKGCGLDVMKKLYLYHIQKPVPEISNLSEGADSDSYANYWDFVRLAISECIACEDESRQLPQEFVADIIMFSTNKDALYIIAQLEETDVEMWDGGSVDLESFNCLRRLAYNRLMRLLGTI